MFVASQSPETRLESPAALLAEAGLLESDQARLAAVRGAILGSAFGTLVWGVMLGAAWLIHQAV